MIPPALSEAAYFCSMAKTLKGSITFVHHDKDYVTIEYEAGGKTRTINGSTKQSEQDKGKKRHHFREGDQIEFVLAKSPRGDKMVADNIVFRYNNSLNDLLNKAKIENRFTGYLKKVEERYFIKEKDSYHFFPLVLSPFEKHPSEWDINEPVLFKLENIQNPDKVSAKLHSSTLTAAYKKAEKLYTGKTVIDAKVSKVSPHAVYVSVIGNEVTAKLPVAKDAVVKEKAGDTISILITYLSPDKIVIEREGS